MTEAQKRLDLARKLSAELEPLSKCSILVGSVAHSPSKVTEKSDVDLVIVVDELYSVIEQVAQNQRDREALRTRFFDGYCVKRTEDEIPVSTHFLSDDAFDIISKCNVADIRVYRPSPKNEDYILYGFEGQSYPYWVKNIELRDLPGSRAIVPISFIKDDRYLIGIHRDKLLSKPQILYDPQDSARARIGRLWTTVVRNLAAESYRLISGIDLSRMNILNALSKKEKMSDESRKFVAEQTQKYLEDIGALK